MQDEALVLNITNKNDLYSAYMPFIKNGGVFVPIVGDYQTGQMVTLTLKLWCLPEEVTFTGKVVWVTPQHAQGGRPAGIGVQFLQENTKLIKDTIEKQLAGLLQGEQGTHTI